MNVKKILNILEEMYPSAKCELNYTTPFELLIATILSAQCTDVRVNIVTKDLFEKYNKPQDFINLGLDKLENMIKSCGLYKTKAQNIINTCEKILKEFNGQVPDKLDDLIKLDGVGRKTANVVLSNAFNVPAIAVDTHVFRVANRIGIVREKNVYDTEFALMKVVDKDMWSKAHHLFIFHGRRICKAKNPQCRNCSLNLYCNYYLSKGEN